MPVAGHHVIERVAERARHESDDRGETPDASEVSGRSERGGRAGEESLGCMVARGVEPHHRVHPRELRVPRENRTAKSAVEWSEPERPPAIVPEDELHALGAESARAVVQQHRRVGAVHSPVLVVQSDSLALSTAVVRSGPMPLR